MKKEDIKLGVSNSIKIPIGAPLKDITLTDLVKLQEFSRGKDKGSQPAIWCCPDKRSIYSPTRIGFLDIDTVEGVDTVIENRELLFSTASNIVAIQKSFSGKLHIIVLLGYDDIDSEMEWTKQYNLQSAIVLRFIEKLFGFNYLKIEAKPGEPAFDYHNSNWRQGLYVSGNEWYFNEFPTSISLCHTDVKKLEEWRGASFDVAKKESNQVHNGPIELKTDILGGYEINYSGEKLTIDDTYKVGNYSGNELRWRISSLLYNLCGGDTGKAKTIAESLFNRTQKNNFNEWKNFYNKGVNTIVKEWFIMTFCKPKPVQAKEEVTINGIPLSEWRRLGLIS